MNNRFESVLDDYDAVLGKLKNIMDINIQDAETHNIAVAAGGVILKHLQRELDYYRDNSMDDRVAPRIIISPYAERDGVHSRILQLSNIDSDE